MVINAGAIITPEILFNEINKYKDLIGNRKIYIDPRAMIIQEKHREIEKNILKVVLLLKDVDPHMLIK